MHFLCTGPIQVLKRQPWTRQGPTPGVCYFLKSYTGFPPQEKCLMAIGLICFNWITLPVILTLLLISVCSLTDWDVYFHALGLLLSCSVTSVSKSNSANNLKMIYNLNLSELKKNMLWYLITFWVKSRVSPAPHLVPFLFHRWNRKC